MLSKAIMHAITVHTSIKGKQPTRLYIHEELLTTLREEMKALSPKDAPQPARLWGYGDYFMGLVVNRSINVGFWLRD